jgi:hypothetical protein
MPHAALAEDARDLVDDLLEPGDRAQRVERGAVGGVLPGEGGDVGEGDAGHGVLREVMPLPTGATCGRFRKGSWES